MMFGLALDSRAHQLAEVDLFSRCTRRQLRRIAPLTTMLDIRPGRTLCRQAEVGREFFVIVDGAATVTVDGAEVARLGRGCCFGEIALLEPTRRRTATVSSTTPMTVIVLDPRGFATLMHDVPPVASRVRECHTQRMDALTLLVDPRGRAGRRQELLAGATLAT